MRILLLISLILLSSTTILADTLVVPFEVHPTRSVLLVSAKINGKEVRLIFDTGASSTLLSPEVADARPPAAPSSFSSSGPGMYAEATWSEADLAIGSKRWRRLPVGLIDFAAVRQVYGSQVDGILGQDVMQGFDSVSIDYRSRTLTLTRK